MDTVYRGLVGIPFETGLRGMASRFLQQLDNAHSISRATLREILATNGATEWGRRFGLDRPGALAAFREMPTTTYGDYAPYVERVAAGEPGVLTGDPVTYFAVTSGTTGAQKLIPVTRRQTRAVMQFMMVPMGLALIQGALGPVRGRSLFIATEQISGTTAGGIPRGAATSNGLMRMGRAAELIWTSPTPVVRIKNQAASRYLHLLFALGEERLWTIISFFPSTLLFVLRDLHARAEELLRDLAEGTITRAIELPPAVRADLQRRLRPNPGRAVELAALIDRRRFTVGEIWPDVRLVLSAGSGAFRFYVDQLKPYLGDVPVFSPAYAASEAAIGVGLSPRWPGYALAPSAAYYEFLPLESADSPGARPLALDEVEPGRSYEIVITTFAGLTRYRLGDVVKVIGRYGQAPIVEFIERRGQVINIVGEKTGEAQIATAFEAACRELGAEVVDYVVTPDPEFTPARYLLLIEGLPARADAAPLFDPTPLLQTFERHLRRAAPDYDGSRRIGELGPMVVRVLRPGAFERFRDLRVAAGASPVQVKVPHVMPDPSLVGRHFFDEMLEEIVPADGVEL